MKPLVLALILLEIIGFPLLLVWVIKTEDPIAVSLLVLVSLLGSLGIAAGCIVGMWNPVMKPWPPFEPAPEAVHRNFQSFKLGLLNLGWSVHVSVDQSHLHLRPARLIRWMGAASGSIPWNVMRPVSSTMVNIADHTLIGPRWCMELAAPDQD